MQKFKNTSIQDHVWRDVNGNEVVEDAVHLEEVLANPGAYFDRVGKSGQRLAIQDQQGECTHVILSFGEYQARYNLTAETPEGLLSSLRVSLNGEIAPEDIKNAFRYLADEVEALCEQLQRHGNAPDGPIIGVCALPIGAVALPPDIAFRAVVQLYAMVRAEVAKNLFR